jgi:uncharacterized protein (TIGR03437 family)
VRDLLGWALLRSADGANWSTFWPSLETGVNALLIDPTNTSLIYAGLETGFCKTADGGATDFGNVNRAWLFDPANTAFSATGNLTMPRYVHTSTLLSDGTVLIAGSLAVLLNSGQVLITGGVSGSTGVGPNVTLQGIGNAEVYTPESAPAPALFSLSGDGHGQAAIWHANGTVASTDNPVVAGEVLAMYTTSLVENGVVPPAVSVGGVLAETLYFGDAPGYPGYNQVNFRMPSGVSPGPAVAVWLS